MQFTEHLRNLGAITIRGKGYFLHYIETSCGVHPASGGTGARGSFSGDKVARTGN